MRKIRRKCGLTQEKLAEKAGVSTHFIAMIEIARKFPSPDTLDQIAAALGIETHELFSGPVSAETDLTWLRQSVLNDIERVVGEAVEKALSEKRK
ncbi:MAG: helix-turn-helix transcriptional regulator [Treponema sp.]|jgi:transcriptional regulator with XRE-family HTH domain|nr:helix-turn-helix transcriptional regulator [Treponema sp.]